MKRRISKNLILKIKKFSEKYGFELLSVKPNGFRVKLKLKCKTGHIFTVHWHSFKFSKLCKPCRYQNAADKKKFSLAYVKKIFSDQGCKLLEKEYTGCAKKLRYICKCGRKASILLFNFIRGVRCFKCANEANHIRFKASYEKVFQRFKDKGFNLISTEYKNSAQPLEYICVCGRRAMASFNSLKIINRCRKCWIEYNRGSNNSSWNPNLTDEERNGIRGNRSDKWRLRVYKRDGFTCQICGDNKGGNLTAHHLNAWRTFLQQRFKTKNGITMCIPCHVEYHSFGLSKHGKNTKEDFYLWLVDKMLNNRLMKNDCSINPI